MSVLLPKNKDLQPRLRRASPQQDAPLLPRGVGGEKQGPVFCPRTHVFHISLIKKSDVISFGVQSGLICGLHPWQGPGKQRSQLQATVFCASPLTIM